DHYRRSIRGTEVHTVHTEVEGNARLDFFRRLIGAWRSDGVGFVTLEEIAREVRGDPAQVPRRLLLRTAIPNRGGLVTSTVQVSAMGALEGGPSRRPDGP